MSSSQPPQKIQSDPWWKFNKLTLLLIVGLILINVGNFLTLSFIGNLFISFFSLFDVRTWPWWYFICLIVVTVFSIRWYRLYQKYVNDDFDPMSSYECKWFCILSGFITAIIAAIFFLHWSSLLKYLYGSLYSWFGYGNVSFVAFLTITAILAVIAGVIFLVCKWITTLKE
jgi:hypothetical protein